MRLTLSLSLLCVYAQCRPHERIHLLIDYVEKPIPKYKQLRPGQQLSFQEMTRVWAQLPDAQG